MKYVKFVYSGVEVCGNLIWTEKPAWHRRFQHKIEIHENFLSKTRITAAWATIESSNKNHKIIVIYRSLKEITEITEEEYIAALVLGS